MQTLITSPQVCYDDFAVLPSFLKMARNERNPLPDFAFFQNFSKMQFSKVVNTDSMFQIDALVLHNLVSLLKAEF